MLPPVPGLPGFGTDISRPTSVPGFGLPGRALFLIFCPVEVTPTAKLGSLAPMIADPTLGRPAGLAVVGAAVVLGATVVVVVVVVSLSFFQNFHPASTSTESHSRLICLLLRN